MEEASKKNLVSDLSFGARLRTFISIYYQSLIVILTPIMCLPLLFMSNKQPFQCLFVLINMAVLWITEALPLPVTSFLPMVFFPLFGIMSSEETCRLYFKDTVVMFIGGIMVALAIEYCNLHTRLALRTILIVGCSMRRLHIGLTVVTMFISMWISNSATTAMMCPIIAAILRELETQGLCKFYRSETNEESGGKANADALPYPSKITLCYYLSVAYAASIGGVGTLIGTGTNLVFKGIYESRFPQGPEISFFSFLCYALLPSVLITFCMIIGMQWHLMGLFRPNSVEAQQVKLASAGSDIAEAVIETKYDELGPMSQHEYGVLFLFILLIIGFFTRKPGFFPGWGDYFNEKDVKLSTPTAIVVILMFILPANWTFLRYFWSKEVPTRNAKSLISWTFIHQKTSWGLLFLLGSGFALARAIKLTGLAELISDVLKPIKILPLPLIILVMLLFSEFLTTFSTNVGICNIVEPILAEIAVVIRVHPLNLLYPAGLACSMAFLLPVSTPPNALVSSYANIRSKDMVFAGLIPSIASILVLFMISQSTAYLLYPDLDMFPAWAERTNKTASTQFLQVFYDYY